jgi:hypothetical protein
MSRKKIYYDFLAIVLKESNLQEEIVTMRRDFGYLSKAQK